MKKETTEVEENLFYTREINLVATLLALDFKIIAVDYQAEGNNFRKTCYWGFEVSPELEKIEKEFWNGDVMVNARKFADSLRLLKAKLNNKENSPHS